MDSKTRYRELCKKEPTIPLFSQDWWMDAVCGDADWDVILAEKNDSIVGALPYQITRGFWGLSQIVMPKLTPSIGVWIKYPQDQNYTNRLSYDKEVLNEIIRQLDDLKIAYFSHHFTCSTSNWLPFFWKGFQQTTRYTYVLEDISDLDAVYGRFKSSKRREIKKASEILYVKQDLTAKAFYEYHRRFLAKQKEEIVYSLQVLQRIFSSAYERNQGKVLIGEDHQGTIHGATFIIWDEMSAYWLINALDPEYRSSGVGQLLAWEGIKYVSSRTRQFDFEGSMVEAYEQPYRYFGGTQKAYFNIRKTYSPILLMREGLQTFTKGLKMQIKHIIGKV